MNICVECFMPLDDGVICDPCQNIISNFTDCYPEEQGGEDE